jgi:hypothetical protein
MSAYMTRARPEQKLVSFRASDTELMNIKLDIQDGWNIVSLVPSGSYYVGIMERADSSKEANGVVYIPPRKKIKFTT